MEIENVIPSEARNLSFFALKWAIPRHAACLGMTGFGAWSHHPPHSSIHSTN